MLPVLAESYTKSIINLLTYYKDFRLGDFCFTVSLKSGLYTI